MPLTARVRRPLIAGTLLLFAARLLLSMFRSGPVLVADEIGYLTNARVIAGGLAGQLHLAPFYRGGYSLLLAPLLAIGASPTVTYHLVLALNAALAASVFPLLYLLLRRFCGVEPHVALWAALAGAVYPALSVLSQVAMSENAMFPLICVWLIAWAGLLEACDSGRRAPLWGIGVGASTGALWAVHNRMIVAVVLTAGLLAWLLVRRRLGWQTVAAAFAALAAGLVGTHVLDSFIIDHNYAGHAPNEANERLSALLHQHALRTVLANLLGQTWYLLAATFGLAALVVTEAWASLRRKGPPAPSQAAGSVAALLAALAGLLLLVSAAAFPERTRPDMLIYGRYAEVAAPALVAMGLASLARRRLPKRLLKPLAGFAALTGVVVLVRATASDPNTPNRWNISALPFVTGRLGPAILVGAAAVALAGAYALRQASARGARTLGAVAALLFVAVVAYGAWNPVRSSEVAVYPAGWTSPQGIAEKHNITRVAYDLGDYDTIGLFVVQWFLPKTSLILFRHGVNPPSRYVLASSAWRPPVRARAYRLWTFAGRDQTLWRLPRMIEAPAP
jgi:hypothetical protein